MMLLGFGSIESSHKPFLNLSKKGDLKATFNLFNFFKY